MANRFTPIPVITPAFTLGGIQGTTAILKLRMRPLRPARPISSPDPDPALRRRPEPDLLNDVAQCPKVGALGNDGCGAHYVETPLAAAAAADHRA